MKAKLETVCTAAEPGRLRETIQLTERMQQIETLLGLEAFAIQWIPEWS